MSSTGLLTTQRSTVNAVVTVTTAGRIVTIREFEMVPRAGPGQMVSMDLNADGACDFKLDITFYDPGFEDQDLYGGPKSKGSPEGETVGKRIV